MCLQTKIEVIEIITFDIVFISQPKNHLQTNKEVISLLYIDVKNISAAAKDTKCLFSKRH